MRSVPRFVETPTGYAESFGIQWRRYDVQRPPRIGRSSSPRPGSLAGPRGPARAGCRLRQRPLRRGRGKSGCAGRRGRRHRRRRAGARGLCALAGVQVIQADLLRLPFAPGTFDAIYSIGVLHHTADTRTAFDALVRVLKPGGRLAIWVYRRNTGCRSGELGAPRRRAPPVGSGLHRLALVGAVGGGIPLVRRANLFVPFSSHPDWHIRVCDTYDWYAPRFQHHHTVAETVGWFRAQGFEDVRPLRATCPAAPGTTGSTTGASSPAAASAWWAAARPDAVRRWTPRARERPAALAGP